MLSVDRENKQTTHHQSTSQSWFQVTAYRAPCTTQQGGKNKTFGVHSARCSASGSRHTAKQRGSRQEHYCVPVLTRQKCLMPWAEQKSRHGKLPLHLMAKHLFKEKKKKPNNTQTAETEPTSCPIPAVSDLLRQKQLFRIKGNNTDGSMTTPYWIFQFLQKMGLRDNNQICHLFCTILFRCQSDETLLEYIKNKVQNRWS